MTRKTLDFVLASCVILLMLGLVLNNGDSSAEIILTITPNPTCFGTPVPYPVEAGCEKKYLPITFDTLDPNATATPIPTPTPIPSPTPTAIPSPTTPPYP